MPETGNLDTPHLWHHLFQGVKGGFQVSRALAPAEQQHIGTYSAEALQRPFHLDHQLEVVVQRRREHSHRDVIAVRLLFLARHHGRREPLEQPTRHEVQHWRPHLRSLHAGNHRRGDLALSNLMVETRQPGCRRRVVDHQRRFEDGGLVNGGERESRVEPDDRPRTDANHIVSARFDQERLHIFDVLPDAVLSAVRAAQAAATAVRQVDGEAISQRLGQLTMALGGLHCAVKHDQAWALTELTVADGGAVFRSDGVGTPDLRCTRVIVDVSFHPVSPPPVVSDCSNAFICSCVIQSFPSWISWIVPRTHSNSARSMARAYSPSTTKSRGRRMSAIKLLSCVSTAAIRASSATTRRWSRRTTSSLARPPMKASAAANCGYS